MTSRIEFRRDTAAEWTARDPVLALGEPGYERDTGSRKIGDGVHSWTALPYDLGGQAMSAALEGYVTTEQISNSGGLTGTAPLVGPYSSRPVPSAVTTGLVFHAVDLLQSFVATGPADQPATAWYPLPAAGVELAYARREAGFTINAGTGNQTIFGTQIGFAQPDGPVMVTGRAVVQMAWAATDANLVDPVVGIFEITDPNNPVLLDEAHPGAVHNPADFRHALAQARVTGPVGSWRAFELRGLQRAGGAWSIRGSSTYPITMEAVTR